MRDRAWRLSDLDRYEFDLRGYLLFEGVLGSSTVERLRSVIDAQGLSPPDETLERQRFGQSGQLFMWDQGFHDLLDHTLALAVLSEMIGPYVRLDHAYGIAMRPGTSGLGLHGPAEPFDASQYYLYRMGAMRNGLLSLSWSLSDGAPGDGGLRLHSWEPPSVRAAAGRSRIVGSRGSPTAGLVAGLHRSPDALHDSVAGRRHPAHTHLQVLARQHGMGPLAGGLPGSGGVDVPRQRRFFQPPSVGGRTPTITP